MSLFSRMVNALRPDRLSRDIDEELAAHLEEAKAHGRTAAEARASLGPALRLREESRDARMIPWLDSLRADTVFAWRQINKRRITSLAAILSLGLAIGSCTAAFRIIDALFLRPLPIAHPERLYVLTFHAENVEGKMTSNDACDYPLFRRLNAAAGATADALAISRSAPWSVTYGSDRDIEPANGQYVSGRMFSVFGLRPALGRLLSDDDDTGRHAAAVLSFDYWTRRFGGDPKVVGWTFHYERDLYTIVGVAPEHFTGIEPGILNDIFVPAMMNPHVNDPGFMWLRALLAVRPGITPQRLRDPMQAALHAYWQDRVNTIRGMPPAERDRVMNQTIALESAHSGVSEMQRDYRQALLSLAILIALVLLIACANVANLMTAQAAARAREMALRVSIGAARGRLVQLALVESAILAALAAAVGGIFAIWSAPFVVARINPPDRAARLILPADWRVLGFAFGLTLLVTFLCGLGPALRAAHTNPSNSLKTGGSRRSHVTNPLIAAQVAFCFLVLFVAGLFGTTFQRLSHQPLGFSPERLLALDVVTQDPQSPAFWSRLHGIVQSAPGVEKATNADFALLSGVWFINPIAIEGYYSGRDSANFLSVSPGWFDTMRIPLVSGRDFHANETYRDQVAIVNRQFAARYFKGTDAIGKSFAAPIPSVASFAKITIVGLVENARYGDLRDPIPPVAYFPSNSAPSPATTMMVRTASSNPLALVPTLRDAISTAAPGLRLSSVHTQQEFVDNQTIRERLLAMLGTFFAAVALLLAGVGLYGVLDYSVFQRRREIGIRMAVGARASHIVRGVTFGILAWVLFGAAAGLALGLASARYIAALLYEVKATDMISLAIPALALFTAAILAALPPVLRAIRIDPVETLRSE